MTRAAELIEHFPVPTYLFRVEGDEFVLDSVCALARERNPGLMALVGKPMVGLYSDQPQVIEDARRCATQQVAVSRELAVRRYDRTEATQFLRLTFIPAPPEHVILFLQDVANPEVAQTALNESEARYQSLMASLPDGVLLRGADGRVLFCNEVAIDLFGARDQASLLGQVEVLAPGLQVQRENGEIIEPADIPSVKVLVTGQPEPSQVFALVGQGRLRWVRVAAQPVRSGQGTLTGSITTYSDITDRVAAQGALRESAARLDLALSAAKMGVWELDPVADIGWWSPILDTIFKLAGRSRGISGFLAQVHPEDRARVQSEANVLIQEGRDGDSFEHEYRIVGEDGIVRWARIRGSVKFDGRRRFLSGTVMDITEQRQLEEELRRASRLESLGRLAGGVAHDFNNLLAAMLGSLELIEDLCPVSVRQDLNTIRHSALRARDLTRQLLSFARKQPVELKTVDLASLVSQVELMLRRLVGPNVEIAVVGLEPVFVMADPALLEQVLVNLVVNARDAMPEGGRLEIRVSREPNPPTAILDVSDSGVGIDEDTQKKIFDPFFTTKAHGTGLGLASAYGIVQQHQGTISIESQQGKGTLFRVRLPALPDSASTKSVSTQLDAVRPGTGVVLVLDDEDSVRETAVRMVKSLGYDVISASNGTEAAAFATQHRDILAILLCDIAMPVESGPAIATRLRAQIPGLKVLFMSGYPPEMEGAKLSGSLFLQKPFSRIELAEKLAELQRV